MPFHEKCIVRRYKALLESFSPRYLFSFWTNVINSLSKSKKRLIKAAATDMRYFTSNVDMTSIFKLFCQGRYDTSVEFEWTQRKAVSYNCSPQLCKQVMIKLLLAYSFRKMFSIGQNLKHVPMTNISFNFLWKDISAKIWDLFSWGTVEIVLRAVEILLRPVEILLRTVEILMLNGHGRDFHVEQSRFL